MEIAWAVEGGGGPTVTTGTALPTADPPVSQSPPLAITWAGVQTKKLTVPPGGLLDPEPVITALSWMLWPNTICPKGFPAASDGVVTTEDSQRSKVPPTKSFRIESTEVEARDSARKLAKHSPPRLRKLRSIPPSKKWPAGNTLAWPLTFVFGVNVQGAC